MDKNIKIAGVSLIEVMISMVLIALLLIAVVSIFPRMASHRKGIQESDIAKAIAAETLEYLQAYSIAPSTPATPTNPDPPTNGCSGVKKLSKGDVPDVDADPDNELSYISYHKRYVAPSWYEISWDDPCTNNNADYYPLTVTVRWKKQGKWHTVNVTGTVQ